MTQIERFFVVTRTSLYECFISSGEAQAEKLALRAGNMSRVPVGYSPGFETSTRRLLVISSSDGIRVKNGGTSPIVALFLKEKEEDAWECHFSKKNKGKWAHFWWRFTQATLDAIGPDHPHFRIDPKSPPSCGRPPATEAA